MYPVIRLAKDLILACRMPPLGPLDTHVSQHICWPWDLDIWMELNNGRTLTLYDLGRSMLTVRSGLSNVLRRKRWAVAVAGTSIRYRRRIRGFDRFESRCRAVGWDEKFIYVEQGLWKKGGDCASHALLRMVVTDRNGIVNPQRLLEAWGHDMPSPPLPDWIKAWCDAENLRPWPPMEAETKLKLASAS